MDNKLQHIKNLISANDDNRLAIFVGAGISKSCETKTLKLPTWEDLINDLTKELGLKNEHDYLKLAQLYYLEFQEHSYYKKLKQYFPDNIKPSVIHKLIFDLNPQVVVTTNWDCILESAIVENAFIYDTVSSDKDLVKSTLQKKLIKMHGDFKSHNIVFKEDDYLNYSHNFPLIENYLKSILSTHSVLFIGYSYNDINLKQIMKWLQKHSNVKPPMYLTTFQESSTQDKYLENHGIYSLVLEDVSDEYKSLDSYSSKMASFLTLISSFENLYPESLNDDDVIDFVYKKLSVLSSLNSVLLEQVQKVLTNCGFSYDSKSNPILEFYTNFSTDDQNLKLRKIYKGFIGVLNNIIENQKTSNKILEIFGILQKAGIIGICISEDISNLSDKQYLSFQEYVEPNIDSYLDFNLNEPFKLANDIDELLESAYIHYQLDEYEKAYNLTSEAISTCLKQSNYTYLVIAMFNSNILLNKLKNNSILSDEGQRKFNNIKERIRELPKRLQNTLEPIYKFIDFSYLYEHAYSIAKSLKEKEDKKSIIDSGGFVLSNNIEEYSAKHKNLVRFVLCNKIMLERFKEYRTINHHFLKISIVRQTPNKLVLLSKIELYSCIKYFDIKELKKLFKDFYNLKDKDDKIKLEISDENKAWLIDLVLSNIILAKLKSRYNYNDFV